MGLLEKSITELRRLIQQQKSGKISAEDFERQMIGFSVTAKYVNAYIKAKIVSETQPKVKRELHRTGLIGDGEVVSAEEREPALEMIRCKLHDQIIHRQECLDESGSKENYDVCKDCDHCAVTKNLLLE